MNFMSKNQTYVASIFLPCNLKSVCAVKKRHENTYLIITLARFHRQQLFNFQKGIVIFFFANYQIKSNFGIKLNIVSLEFDYEYT